MVASENIMNKCFILMCVVRFLLVAQVMKLSSRIRDLRIILRLWVKLTFGYPIKSGYILHHFYINLELGKFWEFLAEEIIHTSYDRTYTNTIKPKLQ